MKYCFQTLQKKGKYSQKQHIVGFWFFFLIIISFNVTIPLVTPETKKESPQNMKDKK